jgi:NhaA family Na+:H+ antiporter
VSHAPKKSLVNLLQEFSIPLIAGVFVALAAANLAPEGYAYWFGHGHEGEHFQLGHLSVFGHHLTLHFLVNDIFMVFFFGIATKEIVEACLPGGSLNPFKKALNPLFATMGGVIGPVGAFFGFLFLAHGAGAFPAEFELGALQRGWGIPTATDIALAWLVARAVFGKGHPAINFLLLLAVADDAIGLGIIAIFYGDPANPAAPVWLLLVVAAMAVAFALRKANVQKWQPYVFVAGPIAWCGLMLAHLHPALALCFVVPFLPPPRRDTGLFADEDEVDLGMASAGAHHSALHLFEHQMKRFVDFGLFFFALANAGVAFGGIGPMTWIILGSLVIGKTVGISLCAWLATKLGFPLPERMGAREVVMAGFVAALGLTVALFVSGAAFPTDMAMQGQAKMGALFSGFVAILAIVVGRALGLSKGAVLSDGDHESAPRSDTPTDRPAVHPTDATRIPSALPSGGPAPAMARTERTTDDD